MTDDANTTAPAPKATGDADVITLNKPKIDLKKLPANKLQSAKNSAKNNKWIKLARRYLFYKQAGRWFSGMVLIPWLLAALYYVGIASDRFVSETTFMIEKNNGSTPSMEGFNLFGMSPQTSNDLRILENFIRSPDMLYFLDGQLNLRKHYHTEADWYSRLAADASHDDFLSYYRDHLRIRLNESSGMLELEAQGFTPEFAKQITEHILQRSEAFVNEISHSLANEQQAFVMKEVDLNEGRLRDATAELVNFQNQYGTLSATEEGAALSGILNEMQAELVRSRTELQTLSAYLNQNSSQIVTLKQRISALEQQLDVEQRRLTDEGSLSLNDLAARQKDLQLNIELATKAYTSSLVALETTRTEASRKLKQLVVVSSPFLTEDAKYPRVAYTLTNILLVLLALFGLARMGYATVREHRD